MGYNRGVSYIYPMLYRFGIIEVTEEMEEKMVGKKTKEMIDITGIGKRLITQERIRKLAKNFREAIEYALKNGVFQDDVVMRNFPCGCCGDVTELLGTYLSEHGIKDLWYVCGEYSSDIEGTKDGVGSWISHAWLSVGRPSLSDSLIVDIAGDQFKDNADLGNCDIPVYVGKQDAFHRRFEVEDTRKLKKIWDDTSNATISLIKMYNEIIRR